MSKSLSVDVMTILALVQDLSNTIEESKIVNAARAIRYEKDRKEYDQGLETWVKYTDDRWIAAFILYCEGLTRLIAQRERVVRQRDL